MGYDENLAKIQQHYAEAMEYVDRQIAEFPFRLPGEQRSGEGLARIDVLFEALQVERAARIKLSDYCGATTAPVEGEA